MINLVFEFFAFASVISFAIVAILEIKQFKK